MKNDSVAIYFAMILMFLKPFFLHLHEKSFHILSLEEFSWRISFPHISIIYLHQFVMITIEMWRKKMEKISFLTSKQIEIYDNDFFLCERSNRAWKFSKQFFSLPKTFHLLSMPLINSQTSSPFMTSFTSSQYKKLPSLLLRES
jgi:hypothetical protein